MKFSNAWLLCAAMFIVCPVFSQSSSDTSRYTYQRWIHSVVNLECEGKLFTDFEISMHIDSLRQAGTPSKQLDSLHDALDKFLFTSSGTAFYVQDGEKRFLITAAHVITDQVRTRQTRFEKNDDSAWLKLNKFSLFPRIAVRTPEDASINGIFNNASVDPLPTNKHLSYSLNLQEDIGIISLEGPEWKELRNTLQKDGYVPVPLSDLAMQPRTREGDNVFTIAFPDFLSTVGIAEVPDSLHLTQSNLIVKPLVLYGHIAQKNNSYALAELSVYPGSSGGPVIKGDKIVGFVSEQWSIPLHTKSTSAEIRKLAPQLQSRTTIAIVRNLTWIGAEILQQRKEFKNPYF